MMDYDGGGTTWFGWLAMILVMLAFWGLAAWVLVSVARRRGAPTDAMEQLEERLARGDIDPEDFARRRDLLARSR